MQKICGKVIKKEMESKKVICIGSLNVDIILYIDKFCEDDDEQIINNLEISSGGQAGNIADGLGKLGKNVYFFGNIGEDSYTKMLKQDLDNSNVNYSLAKSTKNKNNSVYGIVDKRGQRRMYAYNNIDFSANDFNEELYDNTEFIIFTSIIKEDAIEIYSEIARKAKEKGIKIVLDPGTVFAELGFEKLKSLLQHCDYIFPSKREFEIILEDRNVDELLNLIPNIFVTCGKEGLVHYTQGSEPKKFPVVSMDKEIVDTIGAGDCFVAGFISSLMEEKSIEEAIKFASVAARISISKKGARSMPLREEIIKNII